MIIDCHGHYTTAPRELEMFRERQLASVLDSTRPRPSTLEISDDQIRETIETRQLKQQRERGTDLAIFSPHNEPVTIFGFNKSNFN